MQQQLATLPTLLSPSFVRYLASGCVIVAELGQQTQQKGLCHCLSLSLCGKMMMFFVFSFRNHSHFCAKGQTDCTFSLLLLLLPVSHGQKPDKAIRYRLMCDMLRGVHVRVCVCVCVCRQQVVFVCFKIFNYFRVSFVVCLFIKSGKSRG